MNSRTLLNVVLLFLVIGLGLLAYYQPGADKPEPSPAVTTLDATKVTRIEVTNNKNPKENAVLTKEKEGWQIVSPVTARANEQRVQSLLEVLKEPSVAKYPVAGADLSKFKLDSPEYKIKIDDTEFSFGDTDPINNRRYLMVGSDIHLVEDKHIHHLLTGLPGLVSLDLLPPQSQIAKIKLPELTLTNENGRWTTSPQQSLSADAITQFVDRWKNAHALRATALEEKSDAKKDIEIHLKEGQVYYFSIISKSSDLVLGSKELGMAFHFDEEQGNKLLKPVEEKVEPAASDSPSPKPAK